MNIYEAFQDELCKLGALAPATRAIQMAGKANRAGASRASIDRTAMAAGQLRAKRLKAVGKSPSIGARDVGVLSKAVNVPTAKSVFKPSQLVSNIRRMNRTRFGMS